MKTIIRVRCGKKFLRELVGLLILPAAVAFTTAGQAPASATTRLSPEAATTKMQALLDHPVNGSVSLPSGTFTIRPSLRLSQGEQIVGHNTTLKVASASGDYAALLSGQTPHTDLSGLRISGITFDQNSAGNSISATSSLFNGQPRFVILVSAGSGITITGNRLTGTDNVDSIVTGSATRNVTISNNIVQGSNPLGHDQSSIYTSGPQTTIIGNTLIGQSMFGAAAIEVHGTGVTVSGNRVSGYPRGANIVASHTSFTGNTVTGALNPVDLWSITAPSLSDVQVTGNTLGRNLNFWKGIYQARGRPLPAAKYTGMVIRDESSKFGFSAIVVSGNKG
jgi:hypothetical protein